MFLLVLLRSLSLRGIASAYSFKFGVLNEIAALQLLIPSLSVVLNRCRTCHILISCTVGWTEIGNGNGEVFSFRFQLVCLTIQIGGCVDIDTSAVLDALLGLHELRLFCYFL